MASRTMLPMVFSARWGEGIVVDVSCRLWRLLVGESLIGINYAALSHDVSLTEQVSKMTQIPARATALYSSADVQVSAGISYGSFPLWGPILYSPLCISNA